MITVDFIVGRTARRRSPMSDCPHNMPATVFHWRSAAYAADNVCIYIHTYIHSCTVVDSARPILLRVSFVIAARREGTFLRRALTRAPAHERVCRFHLFPFSMIVAGGLGGGCGSVCGDGVKLLLLLLLLLLPLSVVVNVVRLCKLFALTDFVKTRRFVSSTI